MKITILKKPDGEANKCEEKSSIKELEYDDRELRVLVTSLEPPGLLLLLLMFSADEKFPVAVVPSFPSRES